MNETQDVMDLSVTMNQPIMEEYQSVIPKGKSPEKKKNIKLTAIQTKILSYCLS